MVSTLIQEHGPATDYQADYDAYWSRADRAGESSRDLECVADHIVKSCGIGNILDVGSGEGRLIDALLKRGVDARGVDVSEVVVSRCNERLPGRFFCGSALALPFDDESFHTLVSTDCMEHLARTDVPKALAEIFRVAKRFVFLQLATTLDRDGHWHLTIEGRAWWESMCFEAGFRKHPAYYVINNYEALNSDDWQIYILLEKLPTAVIAKYPLASLNEERGLHMDMTRDTGERSDAHIIRYQWACDYVKSGDRVLDAACGLGYGGHVIRHLTNANKVVGIDASEYAIDYARKAFPCAEGRAEYYTGILPDILSEYPEGSFDVIVSFETLEHVEAPAQLLQEFYRLLAPGGRVIVSVPNDWSDETGEDPNPFHLHVYDWNRLKSELSVNFILEDVYAQTASHCKVAEKGGAWERRPRSLRQTAPAAQLPEDCEWWLMTAMKSPLESEQPYQERVFANIATSEHPSIRYSEFFDKPWLMHAMVNSGNRLRNMVALESLAEMAMETLRPSSNDYAAALCVKAYRLFERIQESPDETEIILSKIDEFASLPCKDSMGLRWKVSLLSIKGKLLQATGHLGKAKDVFMECAGIDVRQFGIHLATRTTEAFYLAGRIAYSLGERADALACWRSGIEYGEILLGASLDDILINRDFPNRFNHGDGVREYAVAWDNIARCANGVHLLNRGGDVDYSSLDSCHQTEYKSATGELIAARQTLVERTVLFEQASKDVEQRTDELVTVRQALVERTTLLEQTGEALRVQNEELVETRQALVERTALFEQASKDVEQRTDELVAVRQALVERTTLLEQTGEALRVQNEELVKARQILVERTALFEQASKDLEQRTDELVTVRQALVERTTLLEQTDEALHVQNGELVKARQILVERTALFEQASKDLEQRTDELVTVRQALVERTTLLEQTDAALHVQNGELVKARQILVERTALFEQASKDLEQRTDELVTVRQALVERTTLLEQTDAALRVQNEELVGTRQTLVERTALFEQASKDLEQRTDELVTVRQALVERTTLLEQTDAALRVQNEELVGTRQTLVERTALFEQASKDLEQRTDELVTVRQALIERTTLLEQTDEVLRAQNGELVETRQILVERTERLELCNAQLLERTRDLIETRQAITQQAALLSLSRENLLKQTQALADSDQLLASRNVMLESMGAELRQKTSELRVMSAIHEEAQKAPFRFAFKTTLLKLFNSR